MARKSKERGHVMPLRRLFFALAICGLATATLLGFASAQSDAAKQTHKRAASASSAANLPLIDLAGYNQILAKYRGKPVLVTFWATWCEPCRMEYPMIVDLAKQHAPQGLVVVGISLDDDSDMNIVRHFLNEYHPGFPNYRQKPGIDVDEFYHGINPQWTGGMPETIFYAKDGRIAGSFVGAQTREFFQQAIGVILATRSSKNLGNQQSPAGE